MIILDEIELMQIREEMRIKSEYRDSSEEAEKKQNEELDKLDMKMSEFDMGSKGYNPEHPLNKELYKKYVMGDYPEFFEDMIKRRY